MPNNAKKMSNEKINKEKCDENKMKNQKQIRHDRFKKRNKYLIPSSVIWNTEQASAFHNPNI